VVTLNKSNAPKVKNFARDAYSEGYISAADKARLDHAANRKLHGVKPVYEHELDYWGD
jgi:hypothetical protein